MLVAADAISEIVIITGATRIVVPFMLKFILKIRFHWVYLVFKIEMISLDLSLGSKSLETLKFRHFRSASNRAMSLCSTA